MASKRPAFRALPSDNTRSRQLHRQVSAIVRQHVEGACERAWAEIAQRFGRSALFSRTDPSAASAQQAARVLVTLMTNGLSRLAVAALVLPSRESRARRRPWVTTPPRLAAIPGGLRRNGQANGHANGHAAGSTRPGEPPPSR
jgi:hypothetical protein